jgi:enamine deaminase RidA (YjgF/YER057c/UK114 family)
MAAQVELALDNLEAVLTAADMTLGNVVRLNVYTTDVDELATHWARLTAWKRGDSHAQAQGLAVYNA